MQTKDRVPKAKSASGFTLIELAVILIIVGFGITMGAQFFTLYMTQLKHDVTHNNIKLAQDAIFEFYAQNGRYPCPADPKLAVTHDDYGIERCKDNTLPGCVADVVCTNLEAGSPEGGGPDFVMIGALPVRTLLEEIPGYSSVPAEATGFRANNAIDGFGSLLTYAVSEKMTDETTYNVLNPANLNLGAIKLVDQNGVDLTFPPATAQYVIVSHGDNMAGGYVKGGAKQPGCEILDIDGLPAPPGPPPTGTPSELENCDYDDAIFVKGARSLRDGPNYYDDILYFKPSGRGQLWVKVAAEVDGQSYLKNTNLGNVGVGVEVPGARLHVDGDISAQNDILGSAYCRNDNTNCLNPADIDKTGDQCPPGHIARGIHDVDNNDRVRLECVSVFENLPTDLVCPNVGEAVTGMTYDIGGNVTLICSPL